MHNKIVLLTVLSIVMVLATPTVFAQYPANAVYFEPESISETTPYANIAVNTSIDTMSVGMDIYFNPSCVNVTDVDFTGTPYSQSTGWRHFGDHVRVGAMNFVGTVSPGTYVVAKLTFACVGGGYCMSDIEFAKTELTDYNFDKIDAVSWINGTFTCEAAPSLNVSVTANNVSFGTMLAGNRQELNVSLTLNNTGTVDANITAVFKSNVTTGTYGLNGTGGNIILGTNFELGPYRHEKALTNTTATTFISTISAGVEVTYDAILIVPAGQAAGDYSGIVELIIEESS